jgi:hypothetical protein
LATGEEDNQLLATWSRKTHSTKFLVFFLFFVISTAINTHLQDVLHKIKLIYFQEKPCGLRIDAQGGAEREEAE